MGTLRHRNFGQFSKARGDVVEWGLAGSRVSEPVSLAVMLNCTTEAGKVSALCKLIITIKPMHALVCVCPGHQVVLSRWAKSPLQHVSDSGHYQRRKPLVSLQSSKGRLQLGPSHCTGGAAGARAAWWGHLWVQRTCERPGLGEGRPIFVFHS